MWIIFIMAPISKVRYHWACIFTWDHTVERPFSIHVLDAVDEIPKSFIEGPLTYAKRKEEITIASNNDRVSSIFTKIQYGMQ